jgi:hypothetical protein
MAAEPGAGTFPPLEIISTAALSRDAQDGPKAELHIGFRRRPGRDAHSHRRLSLPLRSATPACAVFLNGANHFLRDPRAAERNKHLVDHHVV